MNNSPEIKIVLSILDDAIETNDIDKVKGARKILNDIDRLNYLKSKNYLKN